MKLLIGSEEGLSILEIIASILLLSIIIIGFMPLFFYSGNAVEKSADVIEGTYLSQNLMEEIYEVASSEDGFKTWLVRPATTSTVWQHLTPDENCQKHFQSISDGIIADMYINAVADEEADCEMPEQTNIKNIRITVSTSNKPDVIESQMETVLIWEN